MDDLLLSSRVLRQLKAFATKPPQALLITGANMSGKLTIANLLACKILNIDSKTLEQYAYYKHVIATGDTKLSIGIDEIKNIKYFLQLKTVGSREIKRIIIVEDSHLMTREAQNALLKTLEEPPADTIMILTAASTESLLPTIMSRVSLLSLETPSLDKTIAYFQQKGHAPDEVRSAYYKSGGATGAVRSALESNSVAADEATELAKSILSSPLYEKLLRVDTLAKNKILTIGVMKVMGELCRIKLRNSTTTSRDVIQWKVRLAVVVAAEKNIKLNVNTKLTLTNLCLNL